ncbi:hypothetical protein [Bacillus sp. FJAT-22090]|uniref:hypothetical protein n=1 Tax=Bacillus sp. FJAT-22090 TaxID=1581038 RepID=UPI0016435A9D|nr:hypothetical protein [Bacillus sp. FJAT-22090]
MEYELLAKVGFAISLIVKGGYAFAGSYIVRIGIKYVGDYKNAIANEKGAR